MPRQRINKKTGKKEWFGRAEVQGRSRERRSEPNTKREAKLLDEALRKELLDEIARSASPDKITTIQELCEEYLRGLEAGNMVKTSLISKRLAFRRLFDSIPPKTPVDGLSQVSLRRHLQRVAQDVSAFSSNRDLRHLKSAYNWVIENEMISCPNPFLKIKTLRVDKKERHIPTVDDFRKALDACGNLQDRLMLLTYFETGGRLREILNLRWSDVDLANSSLRLWTGKRKGGREADWICVSANLVALLQQQRYDTGLKEFVFISPRTGTKFYNRPKFFAGIAQKAGIERFTAHEIRHLMATLMLHGGESIATIQKVLRHTSPITTTLYLHSFKGVTQSNIIAKASADLLGLSKPTEQAHAQAQ